MSQLQAIRRFEDHMNERYGWKIVSQKPCPYCGGTLSEKHRLLEKIIECDTCDYDLVDYLDGY